MATYLHGSSEIQADSAASLQTLYLMTPNYLTAAATGYSDTHHVLHPTQSHHHHHQYNPGLLLLNSPHLSNANQGHFVGLPLPVGSSISEDLNRSFSSSSSSSSRFHYNMWAGGPPATDKSSSIPGTTTTTGTHQGLSLSLSYREQAAGNLSTSQAAQASIIANGGREDASPSNGDVMGSKYLKAAQQLLDEVVKVGKGGISGSDYQVAEGGGEGERREKLGKGDQSTGRVEGSGGGGESSGKRGHDQLTTAQRQELQMKKAKLVNMLDEVEQRYKQYHNQMQIVVSSFEQAAGTGSTKSYTALALQTISKQFRCLKDAIAAQIKAVAGGLGEDDGGAEGSRVLKFVDQQLRQQRALQQIGMIMPPQHHNHHNAWRPQRGLPETAVSVLRAWLFEHFLHPYPKDSDKHMLAKQTGLTRSQVSNWFINARVRLWKPMVEEMYLEEMKQHDQESNNIVGNGRNTTTNNVGPNKELAGESKSVSPQQRIDHHHHHHHHRSSSSSNTHVINNPSTFHLEQQILRVPNHVYSSPKKPKPLENSDNMNGGSFGNYNINPLMGGDDHRFDHEEELAGAGFHDFLSNQMVQTSHYGGDGGGGGGMITSNSPHSSIMNIGYETISAISNNRKRFAAPLLPDFVA